MNCRQSLHEMIKGLAITASPLPRSTFEVNQVLRKSAQNVHKHVKNPVRRYFINLLLGEITFRQVS